MLRIQSSPKRTWSYPVYRIQRLEVCPSGVGPSKSFNMAAPRFPGGTQKEKESGMFCSSDGALLTSPHPFLTEATKVQVTRYEKGLPFTARKLSCLFHCATLDPLEPNQRAAYPLSFRSAAPQPHHVRGQLLRKEGDRVPMKVIQLPTLFFSVRRSRS